MPHFQPTHRDADSNSWIGEFSVRRFFTIEVLAQAQKSRATDFGIKPRHIALHQRRA
jgi:hypothetical protein